MEKCIDTALKFVDIGIGVIPIRYRTKRPTFPWKEYQSKLPTRDELNEWFRSKFVNIATITGFSGMVVIDFDTPDIWKLWQLWINVKMPNLLHKTYRVSTRRGQHVYLFLENPPKRTLKIKNEDGQTLIDVKAAGGYCLAPPSIHPTGYKYQSFNQPSDIVTVASIHEVLPCMLVEKATEQVELPISSGFNGSRDVWSVTTEIDGDPISWIKDNRSILEFLSHAIPSGGSRWYKVLCPFHDDNTESGWIDTQRNRFGCQACLNGSLDVIDFYAMLKQVDRKQAIWELMR